MEGFRRNGVSQFLLGPLEADPERVEQRYVPYQQDKGVDVLDCIWLEAWTKK